MYAFTRPSHGGQSHAFIVHGPGTNSIFETLIYYKGVAIYSLLLYIYPFPYLSFLKLLNYHMMSILGCLPFPIGVGKCMFSPLLT